MTKQSIESFYLRLAIQELFPQAEVRGQGNLGKLFFLDCDFPFSLNSEIFSQLQENMLNAMKEFDERHVFEMVPNVAKQFLHHHHQGSLAEEIDFDSPLVHLIQIGSKFFLSNEEVESKNPFICTRLVLYRHYFDLFGKKIVRIYGVSQSDKQKLKDAIKQLAFFIKKDEESWLNSQTEFAQWAGTVFLTDQGRIQKFKIIEELRNCFLSIGYPFCEPFEKMGEAPFVQMHLPKEQIQLGLGPFYDQLISLKEEKGIELVTKLDLESGLKKSADFLHAIDSAFSSLGVHVAYESVIGLEKTGFFDLLGKDFLIERVQTKNRNKFQISGIGSHPIGIKRMFFKIELENQNQEIFLKITIFSPFSSWLAWIKDWREAKF